MNRPAALALLRGRAISATDTAPECSTFDPDLSICNLEVGGIDLEVACSQGIRWSNMMAIAVAASLPILAIYAFTHRLLRNGLALGSVR